MPVYSVYLITQMQPRKLTASNIALNPGLYIFTDLLCFDNMYLIINISVHDKFSLRLAMSIELMQTDLLRRLENLKT